MVASLEFIWKKFLSIWSEVALEFGSFTVPLTFHLSPISGTDGRQVNGFRLFGMTERFGQNPVKMLFVSFWDF